MGYLLSSYISSAAISETLISESFPTSSILIILKSKLSFDVAPASSNLFIKVLNSNVLINSRLSELYISSPFMSSSDTSSGTSQLIVTSIFEKYASSLPSVRSFADLGFSFSRLAYRLSKLWYSDISEVAVFSPIPDTPGTLSELSPMSAFTSINSSGVTLYSFFTSSG